MTTSPLDFTVSNILSWHVIAASSGYFVTEITNAIPSIIGTPPVTPIETAIYSATHVGLQYLSILLPDDSRIKAIWHITAPILAALFTETMTGTVVLTLRTVIWINAVPAVFVGSLIVIYLIYAKIKSNMSPPSPNELPYWWSRKYSSSSLTPYRDSEREIEQKHHDWTQERTKKLCDQEMQRLAPRLSVITSVLAIGAVPYVHQSICKAIPIALNATYNALPTLIRVSAICVANAFVLYLLYQGVQKIRAHN